MAEGGLPEFSHSLMAASEDGDLSKSIRTGSDFVYDFYCEPCDRVDIHVEAASYCKNCQEYMCKKCSIYHKRFKCSRDHNILDVHHMTNKPPFSNKLPALTTATYVKDINIAGKDNISSSVITSPNRLLVAKRYVRDFSYYTKFILVDTVSGRPISELELSGPSRHATRISDTEAAVTFNYQIVLLRTQNQLSVVRRINVQGEPWGIAYMNSKFIVAYLCNSHVDILDMSGELLHTISADKLGTKIFSVPLFVTANPATGSMYVSDWVSDGTQCRLIKLSMEGRVESIYEYSEEHKPCLVTLVGEGMVYIIRKTKQSFGLVDCFCVEQLSVDCKKVRTIISYLPSRPWGLSFDTATQQLYVGLTKNVLEKFVVYQLS